MKSLKYAVIATLLMLSPARAIDFTQPILNPDGSAPEVKEGQKAPTLGSISESALSAQYRDEVDAQGKETISGQEKYDRWKLATKVHGKDVTLSPEDLALLKRLIGKAYTSVIVGPAWSMLDPSLK